MPETVSPIIAPEIITTRPEAMHPHFWLRVLDCHITAQELDLFHAEKKDPKFISNEPGRGAQREWLCMVIGHPSMKTTELSAFINKARTIKMLPEVIAAAFASLLNENHFYAFLKYCPGVERRPSVLWALISLEKTSMINTYLQNHLSNEAALELITAEDYRALNLAVNVCRNRWIFITLFKQLPRELHTVALIMTGLRAITIALHHSLSPEIENVLLHTPKAIIDENLEDAQLLFTETVRLGHVACVAHLLQEARETAETLASDAHNSAFHAALKNKDITMVRLLLRLPSIFDCAQQMSHSGCHEFLKSFALEEAHRLAGHPVSPETGEIELSSTECRLAAILLEFLTNHYPQAHGLERQLLLQLPGVQDIYTLRLEKSPLQAPTLGIFNVRQAQRMNAEAACSSTTYEC